MKSWESFIRQAQSKAFKRRRSSFRYPNDKFESFYRVLLARSELIAF